MILKDGGSARDAQGHGEVQGTGGPAGWAEADGRVGCCHPLLCRRLKAEHLKAKGDEAIKHGNFREAWER